MARGTPISSVRLRLWSRSIALAAAMIAILVGSGCSTDRVAAPMDFPGSTRQQIVAERDNAAIVQIIAEYKATVSVPTFGYNQGAIDGLASSIVSQAVNGEISSDTKSVLDAFTKAINANPDAYFTANPPSQDSSVTLDYQCSGSIVTPDGYIVTAAHCTNVASDTRQKDYIDAGFPKIRDAAVQRFQSENFQGSSGGASFDADQQKLLTDAVTAFLTKRIQTAEDKPAYTTVLPIPTDSTSQHPLPVTVVTQGNAPAASTGPFGDKDVSIVKLEGYTELPTLPVGSDTDVEAGQPIYIDGYPAAGNAGTKSTATSPTVTSGTISSKQRSDQGVPILGTSATTSFGNSGGPGLDDSGQLVGVVSYGSTQASYNFLIGGSVVQQYLHEKNIQPRESTTTHLYDVALNDFHRQFYKRALQGFQQVKALDSTHPFVDSFIQKSTEQINQGKDQTPPLEGTALVLAIVGAVVLVLLLVAGGLGLVLVVRSRGRRAPAVAAAAAGPGAPPPAPAAPQRWTEPPPPTPEWRGSPQPPPQQWTAPPAAPPPAPPQPPPAQWAAPAAAPPPPAAPPQWSPPAAAPPAPPQPPPAAPPPAQWAPPAAAPPAPPQPPPAAPPPAQWAPPAAAPPAPPQPPPAAPPPAQWAPPAAAPPPPPAAPPPPAQPPAPPEAPAQPDPNIAWRWDGQQWVPVRLNYPTPPPKGPPPGTPGT